MNRRIRVRRVAPGFTLVELLVVITIIGMLASLVLVALASVRETARRDKTRATIAKLKNIIEPLYDSYRTRRVALNTTGMTPAQAAYARLYGLRDLMRMEMPDRRSDLLDPATGNGRGAVSGVPLPSVYQAYVRRALAAAGKGINGKGMDQNAPAECLYMIVSLLGGEDARKQFSDDEVADTDSNGLPEFIDGWGQPIRFLRWPSAFVDSDIQMAMRFTVKDSNGNDTQLEPDPTNAVYLGLLSKSDHDPFDSRRIDVPINPTDPPRGWRLVPLIYSVGRDGVSGLGEDAPDGSPAYVWKNMSDAYGFPLGLPVTNSDGHYDNIHSHRLEVP